MLSDAAEEITIFFVAVLCTMAKKLERKVQGTFPATEQAYAKGTSPKKTADIEITFCSSFLQEPDK